MSRTSQHLLALVCVVAALCLLYVAPPGMSDDLHYWTTAQQVHELGFKGWTVDFHDLRWPVWGVCWLLQGMFGLSMVAYTGTAIAYMCAGSAICFLWGQILLRSQPGAWACGLAFVFHPILDDLCHAPWPDLSEGIWTGAATLCWWYLMHAAGHRSSLAWSALTGLCVFLAEANRITGVFIAPVLGLCTLLFFRRKVGWLLAAAAFAALFYGLEALFYGWLFRDPLHSLHSSQSAKGVRGTEPVPLAALPFRFLDSLWGRGFLAPLYCILAVLGALVACWNRLRSPVAAEVTGNPQIAGKVVTIWLALLYLEFACAPQSLHPWRPIVRDGARFLGSLAVPISILAAVALVCLFRTPLLLRWRGIRWLPEHPAVAAVAALALVIPASYRTRDLPTLGFVPDLRRYVRSVPDETTVVTSSRLKALALLAGGGSPTRLRWLVDNNMPTWNPESEAMLRKADEVWLLHKTFFLMNKIDLSRERPTQLSHRHTSLFAEDAAAWQVRQVIAPETSSMVFLRRRPADAPAPVFPSLEEAGLSGIAPVLPFQWESGGKKHKTVRHDWKLPGVLRGKWCNLTISSSSNHVEPYLLNLTFMQGSRELSHYLLRPYCFQENAKDYFTFGIPPEADHCLVEVQQNKRTKWFSLTDLRLSVEPQTIPMAATK